MTVTNDQLKAALLAARAHGKVFRDEVLASILEAGGTDEAAKEYLAAHEGVTLLTGCTCKPVAGSHRPWCAWAALRPQGRRGK